MSKIVCGAFHEKVHSFCSDSKVIELYREKSAKSVSKNIFSLEKCVLAGVDRQNYTAPDGSLKPLHLFCAREFGDNKVILVLTNTERRILRRAAGLSSIQIKSIEKLAYFVKTEFYNNASLSLARLRETHAKCYRKYGRSPTEITNWCFNKIARKIGRISSLDEGFAFTQRGGIQEAYTFKEFRENRRILAYDFNSMFPACMCIENFPDPSSLEYKQFNCEYKSGMELGYGIFEVKLEGPKDYFIKRYNPFKYVFLTHKFNLFLEDTDSVNIVLHTNEIEFYSRHFNKITIVDGIFSKSAIRHPLSNSVRRLYKQRLRFKRDNDKEGDSYTKLLLTLYCSASRVNKEEVKHFSNCSDVFEFLIFNFDIRNPTYLHPSRFFKYLRGGGKVVPEFDGSKTTVTYNRNKGNRMVNSLLSQLFANARVKMMETLEHILSFEDAEICYVNVDSVHISVPLDKFEALKSHMQCLVDDNPKQPALGKLKLECDDADKGCWFQPGRFWLFKKDRIIKCANMFLRNKIANLSFEPVKRFDVSKKCGKDMNLTEVSTVTVGGSTNFKCVLNGSPKSKHQTFGRFKYENVCDYRSIENTINDERDRTLAHKVNTYSMMGQIFREPGTDDDNENKDEQIK